MANVYSQVLWAQTNLTHASVSYSPTVPSGYVWVVRDVLLWCNNNPNQPLYGITLGDSAGHILGGVWNPDARCMYLYHQEMRQVLSAGQRISAGTYDYFWSVRISGYALTTP